MFFYTSLLIACVIAAFLGLYLFNAVANAGKAFQSTLQSKPRDNVTGHIEKTRYYSTRNSTPAPWGWKGSQKEIRNRGPRTATVNGASSLNAIINNHDNKSKSVGWLHREEKAEFAGSSYKVSRRPGSISGRKLGGKPWGW